jgi:hypothetical protein
MEQSDFPDYSLFIFHDLFPGPTRAGKPTRSHEMQNIFIYMESVFLSREERA